MYSPFDTFTIGMYSGEVCFQIEQTSHVTDRSLSSSWAPMARVILHSLENFIFILRKIVVIVGFDDLTLFLLYSGPLLNIGTLLGTKDVGVEVFWKKKEKTFCGCGDMKI